MGSKNLNTQGNDQPDPVKHRRSRASVHFTCLGCSLQPKSACLHPRQCPKPARTHACTHEGDRKATQTLSRAAALQEHQDRRAILRREGQVLTGTFIRWPPISQHVEPLLLPRRGRHCPRFSWILLLPPSSLPPPCPTRCQSERPRGRALMTGADRAATTHKVGDRWLLGLAGATEIHNWFSSYSAGTLQQRQTALPGTDSTWTPAPGTRAVGPLYHLLLCRSPQLYNCQARGKKNHSGPTPTATVTETAVAARAPQPPSTACPLGYVCHPAGCRPPRALWICPLPGGQSRCQEKCHTSFAFAV